jgi:glycosyltransferase involved in cell wall biosynthesis/predicted O-linked N-acetylglucosamine transferase (SPINDLY family)
MANRSSYRVVFCLFLFSIFSIQQRTRASNNTNSNDHGNALFDYHLFIEGWGSTGISHSYSIVESNLLNAMRSMTRSALFSKPIIKKVQCPKFYLEKWKESQVCSNRYVNLNTVNKSTSKLTSGRIKRINIRFTFPFNFENDDSNNYDHTFVFATTEFYNTSAILFAKKVDQIFDNRKITIVTPSKWSKYGFLNGELKNIDETNIEILPHGINTDVFKPILVQNDRNRIRRIYFKKIFNLTNDNVIDDNSIIFLSVGAMTWNKGIDLLISAFVKLCTEYERDENTKQKFDNQHDATDYSIQKYMLILKGNDALYESKEMFLKILTKIPGGIDLYNKKWIVYYGKELKQSDLSLLYGGADVYVSPYRAEAFNIPIFEAIASGLLVIVTDYRNDENKIWSPSNKWLDDSFTLRIKSTIERVTSYSNYYSYCFQPDLNDLYLKMKLAASPSYLDSRLHAKIVGPQHIKSCLTWDIIAKKFLDIIDNKIYPKPFVRIEEPQYNMVYTTQEASVDGGLNVKIVVGFGDDMYHYRNGGNIQWNLCIWSNKVSAESFYINDKVINNEQKRDDQICETIVEKDDTDHNYIINEKRVAIKFRFKYAATHGKGLYNIHVELKKNANNVVLKENGKGDFDSSFLIQKHVLIHVLGVQKESEIYSMNLIESGHFNIGKYYFAKNALLKLPIASHNYRNTTNSDKNTVAFVKYLTFIPPIINFNSRNNNSPDAMYNAYIDRLKLLDEYTNRKQIYIDLFKLYPAKDERKSFQKDNQNNPSPVVNTYLLLPNVFLSYYNEDDSKEYVTTINKLLNKWILSSFIINNIENKMKLAHAQHMLPSKLLVDKRGLGKDISFKTKIVGFISTTLYTHSVGKLMIGTIRELSYFQKQENYIIKIFMPGVLLEQSTTDVIVQHLKSFDVEIVPFATTDVEKSSLTIKESNVDLLIYTDLGTDPFTYTLSYMRLAMIQIAFWGNPILPESGEIDYFMVSEFHQVREHYNIDNNFNSPQIVQLKGLACFVFRPMLSLRNANTSKITWGKYILTSIKPKTINEIKILLITQALCKIHPTFDQTVRQILINDFNAHIVMLAGFGPIWAGRLIIRFRRLHHQFGDRDRWIDRIHILRRLPAHAYTSLIQSSYLMLNTFPYSGFTTSLEALSLKLPVITLRGNSPRSSQTTMLYNNMYRRDKQTFAFWSRCCIANNVTDYVKKTLYMLSNTTYRKEVSDKLEENVDDIFKQEEAIRSWLNFFRRVI